MVKNMRKKVYKANNFILYNLQYQILLQRKYLIGPYLGKRYLKHSFF